MIAPLLVAWMIPFGGGDVSQLAKSISESTKLPVVFEAGASERAPAFEYPAEDVNELTRVVLSQAGFRRAPGGRHAFHHGRLGSWRFGAQGLNRLVNHTSWRRTNGELPAGFVKDGKVTLKTPPGEAFSVNSLPANLMDKPLQVHWMFEGVGLKAWVTDLPAEEFLNYLARAVGGVLLTRQDRFFLNIDAAEVQRRAVATLAEAQKNKTYSRISTREQFEIELSRAAIASVGSAQLSQLLAAPDGRLRFEITGAMRPGIYEYVTVMLNGSASEAQASEQFARAAQLAELAHSQGNAQAQQLEQALREVMIAQRGRNSNNRLNSIDPRIWGFAEMDARFRVTLQLASVPDSRGRQGPPVRLP